MIEHVRSLRKVVVVWLSILTLLLLGGGIVEDYRSCQRQIPVREISAQRSDQLKQAFHDDADRATAYATIDADPRGSRVNMQYAAARRALAISIEAAPPIDCSTFPPGR